LSLNAKATCPHANNKALDQHRQKYRHQYGSENQLSRANQALISLLPKHADAVEVKDFR
jgi:hypothetical protein